MSDNPTFTTRRRVVEITREDNMKARRNRWTNMNRFDTLTVSKAPVVFTETLEGVIDSVSSYGSYLGRLLGKHQDLVSAQEAYMVHSTMLTWEENPPSNIAEAKTRLEVIHENLNWWKQEILRRQKKEIEETKKRRQAAHEERLKELRLTEEQYQERKRRRMEREAEKDRREREDRDRRITEARALVAFYRDSQVPITDEGEIYELRRAISMVPKHEVTYRVWLQANRHMSLPRSTMIDLDDYLEYADRFVPKTSSAISRIWHKRENKRFRRGTWVMLQRYFGGDEAAHRVWRREIRERYGQTGEEIDWTLEWNKLRAKNTKKRR